MSELAVRRPQARYLIIKLAALGDLFYALPAIRRIRHYDPSCRIEWLVTESLSEVLTLFPGIDQIHTVPGKDLNSPSRLTRLLAVLCARRKLAGRYDGIFLLHRHPLYNLLVFGKGPIFRLVRGPHAWAAKPPRALDRWPGWLLGGGKNVVVPPLSLHESRAIEKVIEAGFADTRKAITREGSRQRELPWSVELPTRSSGKKRRIAIHLGGGQNEKTEFQLKRWPRMGELVARILRERTENIILVGAEAERAEAEAVCASLRSFSMQERVENKVGRTNLIELIELLSSVDLVVGPDSGPLHIADQLGVNCLGIYGPTSRISWGLLGANSRTIGRDVPCSPCYLDDGNFRPCPNDLICMKELSLDEVMSAAQAILELPCEKKR
ncbi:MAG: hypothetical protein C5B49_13540 [Bdellovibrio sp.]|nr:MAG: hypothetical protein C5B49_13540 [Bdellovibrio sp.]